MTIFEAAERYRAEGTPLVVLAGKEYGSGSSRDWAAKGPKLLGVRAVIAESFERIHRSNLLMMGVLPLQYHAGREPRVARADGREEFSIVGLENGEAERGDGAGGRQGVPRDRPARHAARARVPPARRDTALRAAPPACGLESLPADEDRPAEHVPAMAEVFRLCRSCRRRIAGRVRIVRDSRRASARRTASAASRSGPSRPRDEAITETTGRPRGLEDRDRALERRPRLVAAPRSPRAAAAASRTARRRRRARPGGRPARARRLCRQGCRRRSSRRGREPRRTPPARRDRCARPRARTSDALREPRRLRPARAPTAWNSGEISTPRIWQPNVSARRSAGPPRPDAMSRTRASGPRSSRSPSRRIFSAEVGFWSSCAASATTK